MRLVRTDVLDDERHTLLPSPAPQNAVRHGGYAESRGRQPVRDRPHRRASWNTVARWLDRAAAVCRRFNHGRVAGFVAKELQADQICSFTGGKTRPTWIFAAIEVWSRLWPSTVVGRRSYRNTLALVRDVATRMKFGTCPVIVTDGFEFYGKVIHRVFGPASLYA